MRPEPLQTLHYDLLPVEVYASRADLGLAAALDARELLNRAIAERGEANLILATGNSQLDFLHSLRELDNIDWSRIDVLHLDEYVGLAPDHAASFPLMLRRNLIDAVRPRNFFAIPSQAADVEAACRDYAALLHEHPADVVALGFGENGHIAFNDPPGVRFDDPRWVKVVELAGASRQQQVGEGHFATLADAPTHAITLTIPALLAGKALLCIVPEARKAEAVRACLQDPVSEDMPGSVLRLTAHSRLYLEPDSAALL
ncbi:MAG: 6-phosphogluconolactonase [Burkholderiales bacterium]|nr:6-phosphogluconolactonase [Anaerolineae bacterium]